MIFKTKKQQEGPIQIAVEIVHEHTLSKAIGNRTAFDGLQSQANAFTFTTMLTV